MDSDLLVIHVFVGFFPAIRLTSQLLLVKNGLTGSLSPDSHPASQSKDSNKGKHVDGEGEMPSGAAGGLSEETRLFNSH